MKLLSFKGSMPHTENGFFISFRMTQGGAQCAIYKTTGAFAPAVHKLLCVFNRLCLTQQIDLNLPGILKLGFDFLRDFTR